ncbi:MAG: M1 family aminopeptidase [Calditrichaceae bacterium]
MSVRQIYLFMFILVVFMSQSGIFASTKHHEKYFQQYVNYTINAKLDPFLHRVDANQELLYTNHSPDTLKIIYFHLYMNKYKAGALTEDGIRKNTVGSMEIFGIKENDSTQTNYEIDRTLMKVTLRDPLPPEYSVRFKLKFAAKLPPASGRYGYYGEHYDVGNWFPVPVVYDRAGWHLHQHIDNEFYQEWGDFRVNLRVPKGYIVGATGNLLNPGTALKDTTWEVRDWFKHNIDDTTTTLWQFEAQQVHDFAWTADPDYVLYQTTFDGITLNVLAMDYNAEGWRQITEWGPRAMRFLVENFGEYPYRQMTVADTYIASGGMEYPNIVFINTYIQPEYALTHFRAVIIHEIAHNWFYGLLGSNQTEYEWLDEGFTSYAEIMGMEALFGTRDNYSYNRNDWFSRYFGFEIDIRQSSMLNYLEWARAGEETDPINTFPDQFRNGIYISQYDKMANVLMMLKSVLGDSVFEAGLKNYYNEWRFKHPYPDDFISVMEKTANHDLDWFFDQWLNSTRQLEYGVGSIHSQKNKSGYHTVVTLINHGDIAMPVDLDIHLKNGQIIKYHIPVDESHKPDKSRITLPSWHFSQKNYSVNLNSPHEADFAVIDPSGAMLDINRLNNRSGLLPPMDFVFMKSQSLAPPVDAYLWEGWPLVFYNDYDHLKLGFKFNGSYLNINHKIDAQFWYKTAYGNVDFDLKYRNPVDWMGLHTNMELGIFTLDGREGLKFGLNKRNNSGDRGPVFRYGTGIMAYRMYGDQYLMSDWDRGDIYLTYLSMNREEISSANRKISDFNVLFKNSVGGSDYQFGLAEINYTRSFYFSYDEHEIKFRFKGGFGEGDIPSQHKFALSGSNGWQEFQDPYYRSKGSLPYPWRRNGHLYRDNGALVRGYSLYLSDTPQLGDNALISSVDYYFPNPISLFRIPVLRDLETAVFADIGQVWSESLPGYDDFRKSAGFSLLFDRLKDLKMIFKIKKIQADFPLWMSHVPGNDEHFAGRWLINFEFSLD